MDECVIKRWNYAMTNLLNPGKITLKGIIDEDFANYRVPSMTLMFPHCSFKCGIEYCQNSELANSENITVSIDDVCRRYLNNPISESIVLQGLEPFDSWEELYEFIWTLRIHYDCSDDIVIYTGYNKYEIADKVDELATLASNIIIKFGRYKTGDNPHYDEVLGVNLASDNQYAERIS